MAGSRDLFDRVDLTALSESSFRNGEQVDTLQIHHATTMSYAGLRALMAPGGRTVSANGALANDGTLYEVVQLDRRAFTSATGFDRRCLTVEACNVALGPTWAISEASRERLARLAVDMYRAGMLRGVWRGPGGILGHSEVPGTYATACPGPSMHIDTIVARAQQLLTETVSAETGAPIINPEDIMSYVIVKREDKPSFALVGPQGARAIPNGSALRGIQKVVAAIRPDGKAPEVSLSGEEWDAGTLNAF